VTVTAIVLAGGRSSRFGRDKLVAELDGRPLVHHALDAVALVADRLVLVLAPDGPAPPIPAMLAARTVTVHDEVAHRGPLAGLATGLAVVTGDDPRGIALVVGADMPSLVPAVLRLLVGALDADPSLGASSLEADPPSPLPMAVRASTAAPAAAALLAADRRGLHGLLQAIPSAALPAATWRALDPDAATLRDVDTPADLDRP
jgi:molybdopterin-guanine dinucleotide biosynthesis protein A